MVCRGDVGDGPVLEDYDGDGWIGGLIDKEKAL